MKTLFINILFLLGLVSCISPNIKSLEDNWDVAAHWNTIEEDDSVIIADVEKIKAKMNIPLNLLTEDYQVIKLDKKACLKNRLSNVFVSDNFIAISCYSFHPLKLFKKDGTFIRDIGTLGTDKGQYNCIADVQMDEANNKIYVLARGFPKPCGILVYDFQGVLLQEIPLINSADIGSSIKVDVANNKILVTNGITARTPNAFRIWEQNMNGDLIQGIYVDKEKIGIPIYDTMTLNHTESTEIFLSYGGNGKEFLYHYNEKENRLVPKFRFLTKQDCIFIYELPSHFIVEYVSEKYNSTPKFIIHKETLRGCQFSGFITPDGLLLNQYNILGKTYDGYFSLMEQESQIKERIQKTVRKNLTKEQNEGLKRLLRMIDEDEEDGFLLFIGKLKN